MKKAIALFFILCALPALIYAQAAKKISIPKSYLFDHFVNGTVLSKSGAVDEAPLNYNSEDQSIIFFRDGQHFILTNLETVDTIYIDGRKFVPVENSFYEVLSDSSPLSLLVSYHSKTRPIAAISNHDSTTKKVSNEISNAITDVYVTRPFNGDNVIEIQRRCWLSDGDKLFKANTERQFIRFFSTNENVIKNYIKEDNINFNKTDDVVKLFAFSNNLLSTRSKIK